MTLRATAKSRSGRLAQLNDDGTGPGLSPGTERWRLLLANWPAKVVLFVCACVLVILVIYPLVSLLWGSFTLAHAGDVGIANYTRVFLEPRIYASLRNTIYIGAGSTIGSLLIGLPIAWVISRTNIRGRGLFKILTFIAFMTPAYQGAVAYMMLAGPNAGYLNTVIASVFGLERGPFNIFSIWGIILVTTINTFPYVVFLCAAALSSVDGRLEDSARILGASKFRILTGITWKLVTPAVLSSSLLVFVHSISLFGSHAFLGLPRGIYTLPTQIYVMFGFPPDYAGAASLSMILVLITVAILFVQRWYLRKRSYVTVAGKSTRPTITHLGPAGRWGMTLFCHVVFALAVYLPVAVLVWTSLSNTRVLRLSLDTLTLDNYRAVLFDVGVTQRGLQNSTWLGISAATIGMVLGGLIAYMILRLRLRGVRLLDYVSLIPFGLPGIVLAVALILAWIRVPLPIYATAWILLIAYLTKTIPLAVRAADSSIRQIDPSLESAARIAGASWLRSIVDITLPLMRSGLIAAWCLIFIQSFQELAATILLFSAGRETAAVAIFQRVEDGRMLQVAALSVIVSLVILVVVGVANRLSGGRVMARLD